MKRNQIILRISALVLAAVLAFTCTDSSVLAYDRLDRTTADAGASLALARFFSAHSDAQARLVKAINTIVAIAPQEDETVDPSERTQDEVDYEAPKTGVVCVEGAVNVRKSTTTLSPIVAQCVMRKELQVVGEHMVNGNLWYHVHVENTEGYVLGRFIRFGEDAVQYFVDLEESKKTSRHLPNDFTIPEGALAGLSDELAAELQDCAAQVRYCIRTDYPEAEENAHYLSMYAILSYMVENLERIRDVSLENRLGDVYNLAVSGIEGCTNARENLKEVAETTDEEFKQRMYAAIEERKKQERLTLGEEVVNFAASFVGTLPYVLGGASLTKGADCSGFLGQVYAHFGILDQDKANAHAYYSGSMRELGYAVSESEILPGDLVCYNGHVAIYYGDGICVHEPSPGKKAEFRDIHMLPIITIRRLIQ